jgi:hypothetical protein
MVLPQICDSPNLEGKVPVFISSSNRVTQLYLQALRSLFLIKNHIEDTVSSSYSIAERESRDTYLFSRYLAADDFFDKMFRHHVTVSSVR